MADAQEITAAAGRHAGSVLPVVLFFAVLILGGLAFAFYLMKKQEKEGKGDGEGAHAEGGGNCTVLDTKRLLEDIVDVEDGIIVTDSGRRFVSAITCRGTDFYNESPKEQLSVMHGYQRFLNVTTAPVTYRLHGKAVDMDAAKERYAAKYAETLDEYEAAMKGMQAAMDRRDGEAAAVLGGTASRCEHRMRHLKEQLRVLEFYSSADTVTDLAQDYVFDWECPPEDGELPYPVLLAKAKRELRAIAGQKIDALAAAGIKARVCTNGEIIDMMRCVAKPVTAQEYKQKMVDSSSYFCDIVESDSERELAEAVRFEDETAILDGFGGFSEEMFGEVRNG